MKVQRQKSTSARRKMRPRAVGTDQLRTLIAAKLEANRAERAALPDPGMEGRPKVREQIEERDRILRYESMQLAQFVGLLDKREAALREAHSALTILRGIESAFETQLAQAKAKLTRQTDDIHERRAGEREIARLEACLDSVRNGWQKIGGAGTPAHSIMPTGLWEAFDDAGIEPESAVPLAYFLGREVKELPDDPDSTTYHEPGWVAILESEVCETIEQIYSHFPEFRRTLAA